MGQNNAVHRTASRTGKTQLSAEWRQTFANCIPCQAELVEVALELRDEQEAE